MDFVLTEKKLKRPTRAERLFSAGRLFFPLLIIVWSFINAAPVFALDPEKLITQYLHDSWTTEQGLPQSATHRVVQTPDGYLWFATHKGLVRFDGLQFTVFNADNTPGIPNDSGHALIAARDGTLWLGTNGGLTHIKDGAYTTYTTADGLSNNEVYDIYEDADGSLWIRTTGGGINHFRDGKATHYKTLHGASVENAYAFSRDRKGTLWIGSYPTGLIALTGEESKIYTTEDGLAFNIATAIHEDRAGNLWVGASGKLNKLEENGKFSEYAIEDKSTGAKAGYITFIEEDRDGNLWLGTTTGLFRFGANRAVSALTTKQGLSNDEVVSIFEDREGSLWVGTHAGGLNRLRDAAFTTYTTADGLVNNDAGEFYQTRSGDLWVGTSGGVSRFRDGKFTNFTVRDGLPNEKVGGLYEDAKGRFWVGTYRGLSEFADGKFRVDVEKNKSLAYGIVFAVTEDRAGSLWVGSFRNGLSRFESSGEAKTFTVSDGLSENRISHLREDQSGNLWVGAYDGGLTRIKDGVFTVYRTTEGLAHNIISAIYEDSAKTLWVGTSGGISRFKDDKFVSITAKDGLHDNGIGGFAEDDAGNFWIASSKGVFRVARQELNDFADGKIERIRSVAYDTADGLKTIESNTGGFRDRGGRIWFSSVKGIAVLDPKRLKINELPPPVHIETFSADGAAASIGETAQLAPGTQNLEFRYVGLSFVAPAKVKYRYRLEGYDQDWVDADTRRVAYYTSLPPGDYNFRVIAANNDGVWNETGATVSFRLRPFFYQTNWFLGLAALGLVVVVVGANGWRVRRLKVQQKRLTAMVTERTRELSEAYRLIETDNERKTKELEEAKQLQLSMLPKKLPQLPNLEIAAYMKPATEVGGDYYDFHVSPDGTLTVAVGDATGHGLKAGTMVTAMKSLFNNLAGEPNIERIFKQSSAALKSMNLRGMFMAMAMAKIKGNRLTISSAGMPAVLIYRQDIQRVEEIFIKAMPLGSPLAAPFEQREVTIAVGDTILLMSDGFPEMFNEKNEMLDFTKAKRLLAVIAAESSQEIINRFVEVGEKWAGTRPPDDDVTFVVLKVKSNE